MQNLDETEDGEISDDTGSDAIEPYIALERPSFAHQSFKPIADDTDESSESSSSSEDSSDEYQRPAKRPKKVTTKTSTKPSGSKHNVWSTVVFEDHIERELKDINVQHSKTYIDRSRDVETYNYSLCLKDRLETEDLDQETEKKIRKKLAALDKKDGSESFVKEEEAVPEDFEQSLQQTQKLLNSRKRKMDQRDIEPQKKTLPKPRLMRVEDLSVTESNTVLEVAQDITLKLHEEKMDLILRVVEICGKELTIRLFHETRETENDGGIMVADGSRRRTPGGVFLYLLRNHEEIPMEKIREVFIEESKAKEKYKRCLRAKRRQGQAEQLRKSIADASELPALPTRVELEIQKGRQKDQVSTAPTMDQITQIEPIEADNVENDDVVDIRFDCE